MISGAGERRAQEEFQGAVAPRFGKEPAGLDGDEQFQKPVE